VPRPALVLLHGYVGDGRGTWGPQIAALADALDVLAWDAPRDPPEDLGLDGFADHVAAFAAEHGLGRPHVAGLSFGGSVALALARRHPELPRTLTLVSAYAGWAGSLSPEETARRLAQALELSRLSADELVQTLLPTMFSPGTPPDAVAAFGDAMRRAYRPAAFRAMARASAEDASDALPAVRVPTLVICGDRDARAPLPVAERLHAAIAGSRLAVIPGAGHVCTLEAPEAVTALMRGVLAADR
jgi:pimeloyl-ACP methyl ester carboxylesterase